MLQHFLRPSGFHPGRVLLLAALCGPLALSSAPAQDLGKRNQHQKDSPRVLGAFKDVVAKPSESTVRITCEGKETALGTIVAAEGFVLTKASMIHGKVLCRFKDGRELEATIVGVQDKHDLALLRVEAKDLKPVEWAESKTAPVGNWVAAPGLGEVPVAVGVVSVAARNLPGERGPRPTPNSGYLGVGLDLEDKEKAVKVSQVMPNTGAAKAGLKVNDVILTVNGQAVQGASKFMETLISLKPGAVVKLHVKRGDQEIDVEATLGKRPIDRGDYQNSLGSELSQHRLGFPTVLQHDTVLKPTDCGGPLVDLDGKAIGVNVARAGRTETYAVPAEAIRPLLPELMSGKLAPPKGPTAAEKLAAARQALEQAEKLKADAEKKATDSKTASEKAEAELREAVKKLADARAMFEKIEKEAKEPEKK